MELPIEFAARMKEMLGDEYDAFVGAYDRPSTPALRINPAKKHNLSDAGASLLSCIGEAVPWAENGFYYDADAIERPGKHPYHEAGAYYIQEASAMIPAAICPVSEGDKVLDLCAAPGGKTTQLAAKLRGTGLLISNEINPARAAILSQNVERMGITDAVVTCHAPHELAEHFSLFFDKIVVDAPCSGEGMFRKEEQALMMWSQDNVELCAARQMDILCSAARMLAPDGYLVYSTCTFAPEENEGTVLKFLSAHPEFEAVEPSDPAVRSCVEQGMLDRGVPAWVTDDDKYDAPLRRTLRLFPHHADVEGHFAALLHKRADAMPASSNEKTKHKKKARGKEQSRNEFALDSAYKLYEEFIESVTDERPEGVPCLFGSELYLCPRDFPSERDGLRILRAGLHLGSIVGATRFEPSHALALALDSAQAKKVFSIDTSAALFYLHGDTLPCSDEKGWHLISVDGFSLGWGKASAGIMKNHYPKGLRKNYIGV